MTSNSPTAELSTAADAALADAFGRQPRPGRGDRILFAVAGVQGEQDYVLLIRKMRKIYRADGRIDEILEADVCAAAADPVEDAPVKGLYRLLYRRTTESGPAWPPSLLPDLASPWERVTAARPDADLEIGQTVSGKGIYAGRWQPEDRYGKRLGKTLHVFAAPTDLQNTSGNRLLLTFEEAVAHVAKLDLLGHKGFECPSDGFLYKVLADGTGIGKWFIPPKELLRGTDRDDAEVHANSLFALRNSGAFNGTFDTTGGGGNAGWYPSWYWSCSERRGYQSSVWGMWFSDGHGGWHYRDNGRLSCRACFVELVI